MTASESVMWIKRMRGVALGTRQRPSHRLNKAKSCEAGASLAREPMAWKTAILNLSAVRTGRERADYAMPHWPDCMEGPQTEDRLDSSGPYDRKSRRPNSSNSFATRRNTYP